MFAAGSFACMAFWTLWFTLWISLESMLARLYELKRGRNEDELGGGRRREEGEIDGSRIKFVLACEVGSDGHYYMG